MTDFVRTICVLGATGTTGRAVVGELVSRSVDVVCLVRTPVDVEGARSIVVDFGDPEAVKRAFADARFDAVISCMASRTGVAADAWAVEYRGNLTVLEVALASGSNGAVGVGHFVLLSAICVQKPKLAFQHAKLKFEAALAESGMRYSIVRPTAFFKSLSGQVERVRSGKAYLQFGDGGLTACKPISDRDLAAYLVDCLDDQARWNRILPIGGPGPAITPRAQGEALFAMIGREARFRSVSPKLLLVAARVLDAVARIVPSLAAKAEYARIGHYYATESMLVLDPRTGRYDADATPETGRDTLFGHYKAMLSGGGEPDSIDRAAS